MQILQHTLFFDYSTFNEINLLKVFFGQRASFYHTKFKHPPFFVNCIFDKYLTMTGSELGLESSEFVKRICSTADKLCYIHNNKVKANAVKSNQKRTNKDFLKDFRDGFCSIKNALIKNGNPHYHKAELYCKEEELVFQKPKIFSREWIDWAQLFFYRNTSDHHTDTLKSFHTLIALIGVFGLFCGAIVLGFDYFAFDYKGRMDVFSLKEAYSSHIRTSIQSHTWGYFLGNLALILVFIGLFLGVVWKCSRDILIALGYVMTLGFLATSPKYLIPVMSLFGGGRAVLDPLGIVGGVYTLLFGLIAYSLIKTARKNSIIPS